MLVGNPLLPNFETASNFQMPFYWDIDSLRMVYVIFYKTICPRDIINFCKENMGNNLNTFQILFFISIHKLRVTMTGFCLKWLRWGPLSIMVMAGGLLSLISDYISGDYHEGPLSGIIIESGFCQACYYLYPTLKVLWYIVIYNDVQ